MRDELLKIISDDTISGEDAAVLIEMIERRRKLTVVKAKHKNAICTRKDGRYYTAIGRGKKLISRANESRDDFLVRLYDAYYATPDCLDSIWDQFFEAYKLGRRDETWRGADLSYNKHIRGTKIATMPLANITNADVDDFFDEISARYVGQHPAKFYARLRTILNAMFRYASRKRLISYIPYSADFTEIATRFKQKAPPQTWTLEKYRSLLNVIDDNDPYERCFHLQTLLGCRTGEMLALRFADVTTDDKGRPVIRIASHNVTRFEQDSDGVYHKHVETVDGTKGRRRNGIHDVPLGEEAQRLIAISQEQGGTYLFAKPDKPDEPLCAAVYNKHLRQLCKRAGVRELSSYAARRLVVSRLQTCENHYDLMKVMGWAYDNTASYATSVTDTMYDKVVNLANPHI